MRSPCGGVPCVLCSVFAGLMTEGRRVEGVAAHTLCGVALTYNTLSTTNGYHRGVSRVSVETSKCTQPAAGMQHPQFFG